jgi:hypothetical protein
MRQISIKFKPRSELHKKAQYAILENALLRWENAVVLGGAALLTVFWPQPFPQWPKWGWSGLGLFGLSGLIYFSLTDAEANTKLLGVLFREYFDTQKIQDKELHQKVEMALEYHQCIEAKIRSQRPGILRDRLEDTAIKITDWISYIYKLALKLYIYRQDKLLSREREMVPQEIKKLNDCRRLESDQTVQKKIDKLLESKENQLQTLQALDNSIRKAELQLEQSITNLATVHSQVQLIDFQNMDNFRTDHLMIDINDQIDQLKDLIDSINEISIKITEGDS